MKARSHTVLMTIALGALALGCSGGKTKPVPVEGIVTLESRPLAGVSVQFMPVAEGGRTAYGVTGEDGTFRLTTSNTGDGALPGEYKVIIKKVEAVVGGAANPEEMTPEERMKMMQKFREEQQKNRGQPQPKSEIHPNYQSEAKTPLRQTVPISGKLELKLTPTGT